VENEIVIVVYKGVMYVGQCTWNSGNAFILRSPRVIIIQQGKASVMVRFEVLFGEPETVTITSEMYWAPTNEELLKEYAAHCSGLILAKGGTA